MLDRNETISFFRSAQDGGKVSKQEFQDFKTLTQQSKSVWSQSLDYVRNLASKVINGDLANQTYQGKALGNLEAGSTAVQLDKLIDKWFYGGDRPVAKSYFENNPYVYKYAEGSLFHDINREDIVQGGIGDCYFLAGLATVADNAPSTIENMFIDNGDGTYTVRFYKKPGVADYVTVDRYLPVTSDGYFAYQGSTSKFDNPDNELWAALAEKAYAQANESGWTGQDGTNSYTGIEFGVGAKALRHITGNSAKFYPTQISLDLFKEVVGYGVGLTFSSRGSYDLVDGSIVAAHSYSFAGFNEVTGKLRLFNPWGINPSDNRGF